MPAIPEITLYERIKEQLTPEKLGVVLVGETSTFVKDPVLVKARPVELVGFFTALEPEGGFEPERYTSFLRAVLKMGEGTGSPTLRVSSKAQIISANKEPVDVFHFGNVTDLSELVFDQVPESEKPPRFPRKRFIDVRVYPSKRYAEQILLYFKESLESGADSKMEWLLKSITKEQQKIMEDKPDSFILSEFPPSPVLSGGKQVRTNNHLFQGEKYRPNSKF